MFSQTDLESLYVKLDLTQGEEVEQFWSRFRWAADLDEPQRVARYARYDGELDAMYQRHGFRADPGNFAAAILAEEAAIEDPADQPVVDTLDLGNGQKLHMIISSRDHVERAAHERPTLKSDTAFYAQGGEAIGVQRSLWRARCHTNQLFHFALAECRRSGAIKVPAAWAPSTIREIVDDGESSILVRDGLAVYRYQRNERFQLACQLTRLLTGDDPPRWLVLKHGPQDGPNSALARVSSIARDETLCFHASGRVQPTIDGLILAAQAPRSEPGFGKLMGPLLESPSVAVRHAASCVLGRVRCSDAVFEVVVSRLCVEEVRMVLELLIRVARIRGGVPAFDALVRGALENPTLYGRDACARALAWLPLLPDRRARIDKLVRDRERRRSRVGCQAKQEAEHHGLFSRDGEFASQEELALFNALKAFVQSADEPARKLLTAAFARGVLSTSDQGAELRVITHEGVELTRQTARIQALFARLRPVLPS